MERLRYTNLDNLRKQKNLWIAWRHVLGTGRSASVEIRNALGKFKQDDFSNISRINRELGADKFDFGAARGAPIKRPGKKPRPIVIPRTEARIVQRALLNELQSVPALAPYFRNPNSFGGIVDRDREAAIREVQRELDNGAKYFVRSDIQEFFTRIPRPQALAALAAPLDSRAAELLERATHLELDNADKLRDLLTLFPTPAIGVAQGLCLSPLMGNVVLHAFDEALNGRGIRCIRFVDDFILLGGSEKTVMKAFDSAQRMLAELQMSAYDPRTNTDKAECGPPSRAIDFLGCLVERGRVQPNARARGKILEKAKSTLAASVSEFSDPARAYAKGLTVSRTLYNLGNTLRGWRDSYDFCHAPDVFRGIDKEVDKLVRLYVARFSVAFSRAAKDEARLLLGVPILATNPSESESAGTDPSAVLA
jgi:RNA-directed DNA polymerase